MLISFDLDGVLIENPFLSGVFPEVKAILKQQYIEITGEEITEERIWKGIVDEYKKRLNSNSSYLAYNWDEIIQEVANKMGCPGKINISVLVEKYCQAPYIKSYDKATQLLEWFRNKKIQLVIITNGYYKYQYPVLKALGMNTYFDKIVTPETVGEIKPAENIFSEAYQDDDLWYHIGNSLVQDILGANKIGAISVWVERDLPPNLKNKDSFNRIKTEEGYKLFKEKLNYELERNRAFREVNETEFVPGYIIYSLEELRDIITSNTNLI